MRWLLISPIVVICVKLHQHMTQVLQANKVEFGDISDANGGKWVTIGLMLNLAGFGLLVV